MPLNRIYKYQIDKSLNSNDQLFAVTKLVDQQIYANYHLFKTNYIAFDYQEQSTEFSNYYTEKEKDDFLKYLRKQSIVDDVSEEKMLHYLLLIYSNPVRTKFGKPITENFNLE